MQESFDPPVTGEASSCSTTRTDGHSCLGPGVADWLVGAF